MTPSTTGGPTAAEPFFRRLAASDSFKTLFREGMELVDEAANYLDGAGRNESKTLVRSVALGYASESMRMTTRLMQLASWLLLQRAVNEGELTPAQAVTEKRRVRLSHQDLATASDIFQQLPLRLRDLSERSMRLQARIMHIDKLLYGRAEEAGRGGQPTAVHANFARVRAAFELPEER